MSEEPRRRGLGRGLSALFGDATPDAAQPRAEVPGSVGEEPVPTGAEQAAAPGETPASGKMIRTLPIELLRPGKYQPRRVFDEEAIHDLVESVREKGILQPILARPHPDGGGLFEIIAGERRWRAAQATGLHQMPAIIREMSDREALEVGLIENLQRQDLSPLEEAEGYRRLMDDFSHTQEALAKTLGKSRSHVANTMRLLALPDPVKRMLDDGVLSAGHARALLTSEDAVHLAQQVVAKGLNVRQTEKLAQRGLAKAKAKGKGGEAAARDPDLVALEQDLSSLLGLKVLIRASAKGGEVSVQYDTLEQLDDILHRLSGGQHGRVVEAAGDALEFE